MLPKALSYYLSIVIKYPNSLFTNKPLSKYKFDNSQDVSGVNAQE